MSACQAPAHLWRQHSLSSRYYQNLIKSPSLFWSLQLPVGIQRLQQALSRAVVAYQPQFAERSFPPPICHSSVSLLFTSIKHGSKDLSNIQSRCWITPCKGQARWLPNHRTVQEIHSRCLRCEQLPQPATARLERHHLLHQRGLFRVYNLLNRIHR